MIHPDLYYRLWVQQEDARIRELEFRRSRHEASEARGGELRTASGQERTKTRRYGLIEVAIRLLQVGVSWVSAL
jgi:hypothetical protein